MWDTHTGLAILFKYLQVCSEEKYSSFVTKSRKSLDRLAIGEQELAHQSLEAAIKKANSVVQKHKQADSSEFEKLSHEAYTYLKKADICFDTPIERLKK